MPLNHFILVWGMAPQTRSIDCGFNNYILSVGTYFSSTFILNVLKESPISRFSIMTRENHRSIWWYALSLFGLYIAGPIHSGGRWCLIEVFKGTREPSKYLLQRTLVPAQNLTKPVICADKHIFRRYRMLGSTSLNIQIKAGRQDQLEFVSDCPRSFMCLETGFSTRDTIFLVRSEALYVYVWTHNWLHGDLNPCPLYHALSPVTTCLQEPVIVTDEHSGSMNWCAKY